MFCKGKSTNEGRGEILLKKGGKSNRLGVGVVIIAFVRIVTPYESFFGFKKAPDTTCSGELSIRLGGTKGLKTLPDIFVVGLHNLRKI